MHNIPVKEQYMRVEYNNIVSIYNDYEWREWQEEQKQCDSVVIHLDEPVGTAENPKMDFREPLAGWAPGVYPRICVVCNCHFIGEEKALACADCVYNGDVEYVKELQGSGFKFGGFDKRELSAVPLSLPTEEDRIKKLVSEIHRQIHACRVDAAECEGQITALQNLLEFLDEENILFD
jgi:hypothetical protein